MRVCLVTGEYPPDEGGVADYTRCLAEALVAEGLAIEVVTTARSGPTADLQAANAPDPLDEGEPGRSVVVHRAIRAWDWGALRVLGQVVARSRSDIVHIQYQAAAYGMRPAIHLAPWWLRRRTPARVAVTYHDLRVPYLFPKAGRVRRQAVLVLARAAHLTIATNTSDLDELRIAARPRRLELVPIGSNIPDRPPAGHDRAAWRARAGIAPGTGLVAHFGLVGESKGGRTLLAAIEALRRAGGDVRLVMIGGTAGASDPRNAEALAAFRADVAARGLDEVVVVTGHIPPAEVSAWLHAADVAALPYRDGASYRRGSLLAALSHGLPVVTTLPGPSGGDLPALVDGASALLVPPESPEALARAIREVLDDAALAARLAAGARAVAAHFAWPVIAARHVAHYRELVGPTADG